MTKLPVGEQRRLQKQLWILMRFHYMPDRNCPDHSRQTEGLTGEEMALKMGNTVPEPEF